MRQRSKAQRRREAAEYFDAHGIEETVDEPHEEEVEVQVRKPLSTILSIRLDEDHMAKLKLLAKAQGIGVTTMARKLLNHSVDKPGTQLLLQALDQEDIQSAVSSILNDAKVPPGDGEPVFFVFAKDRLDALGEMISGAATRLFLQALQEGSLSVTPRQPDLFEPLQRELEDVRIT